MPSQFEEEDFYRLNEVMSALPEEDRVQTGSQWAAALGITSEDAESQRI